jgi:hypothetical protein
MLDAAIAAAHLSSHAKVARLSSCSLSCGAKWTRDISKQTAQGLGKSRQSLRRAAWTSSQLDSPPALDENLPQRYPLIDIEALATEWVELIGRIDLIEGLFIPAGVDVSPELSKR